MSQISQSSLLDCHFRFFRHIPSHLLGQVAFRYFLLAILFSSYISNSFVVLFILYPLFAST